MTVIVPQGVGPGMPFAVPMPAAPVAQAQPAPARDSPGSSGKDKKDHKKGDPMKKFMKMAKKYMK